MHKKEYHERDILLDDSDRSDNKDSLEFNENYSSIHHQINVGKIFQVDMSFLKKKAFSKINIDDYLLWDPNKVLNEERTERFEVVHKKLVQEELKNMKIHRPKYYKKIMRKKK